VLSFSHLGDAADHPYTRELLAGACRRAEQIGCAIDEVTVDIDRMGAKRVTQILESRGIRGVLLPPLPAPLDCSQLLQWSRFAIVAANYSAEGLAVDRIVPHHFANCRLLFQRLLADGHKAIGVAVGRDLQSRFNDCHHALYTQLCDRGQIRRIPWLIDPSRARVDRWLRSHRPDVIVADSTSLKTLRPMDGARVVLLDRTSGDAPAGIDQLPAEIGRSAVELLAGKITRGEFGPPEHPQVTMVEGVWREAAGPGVRV